MAAYDLNADGRIVAVANYVRALLGSRDIVARVWTARTGAQSTTTQLATNKLSG